MLSMLWHQPPWPLAPGIGLSGPRKGRREAPGWPSPTYLCLGHRVLSPGSPAALGAFTLIIRKGPSGRAMLLRAAGRLAWRHPVAGAREPRTPPSCSLRQHLQAASDMGGSGGAPRRATARETEARSVHALCMEREHGGARAVSRRPGSPREPRSEGRAGAGVSSRLPEGAMRHRQHFSIDDLMVCKFSEDGRARRRQDPPIQAGARRCK